MLLAIPPLLMSCTGRQKPEGGGCAAPLVSMSYHYYYDDTLHTFYEYGADAEGNETIRATDINAETCEREVLTAGVSDSLRRHLQRIAGEARRQMPRFVRDSVDFQIKWSFRAETTDDTLCAHGDNIMPPQAAEAMEECISAYLMDFPDSIRPMEGYHRLSLYKQWETDGNCGEEDVTRLIDLRPEGLWVEAEGMVQWLDHGHTHRFYYLTDSTRISVKAETPATGAIIRESDNKAYRYKDLTPTSVTIVGDDGKETRCHALKRHAEIMEPAG